MSCYLKKIFNFFGLKCPCRQCKSVVATTAMAKKAVKEERKVAKTKPKTAVINVKTAKTKSEEAQIDGTIKTISAFDLKRRMADEYDLVVVNVFSADYFNDCRIKGSIHIPEHELTERALRHYPQDQKFVVYSASEHCAASKTAYRLLTELGYNNVWVYEGGMKEWYNLGYDNDGNCELPYLKK